MENALQVNKFAPNLIMMGVEHDQLLVTLNHPDHTQVDHFLQLESLLGVHHLVVAVL
jgi:hypothetical protein